MRVILQLEEPVLEKLQALADKNKRSRKNYMEVMLSAISEGNVYIEQNPVLDRQRPHEPSPAPPLPEVKKTPQQWIAEKGEIPDGDTARYQDFIARLDKVTYFDKAAKMGIKLA